MSDCGSAIVTKSIQSTSPTLEEHGLIFSGKHPKQPIMQILELPREVHPYFVGTQAHPELTSRPLRPSPLFLGFVQAALAFSEEKSRQPQAV
jgi:CTP synthase